ncbi:hypothetical protein DSO57_1036347 [Entomophthora muscae]|uniref:Uncharacterized protein n=1 Tax=Entomophthora muscae TaxID=34485 RepID=A0ACC2SZF5_9FUNG|nr:hypothetical protein DSO57_1036347 [Entomophthora muscae]
MSSFNNNQVNKLFPGLDKIMQGYTGSLNSEAYVYDHSQPAGPSSSTTQECVPSPASSSMALFAHQAQAAANPNPLSAMALKSSQDGVTTKFPDLPSNISYNIQGGLMSHPLTYLTLWVNLMAISNGGYFILIRGTANLTC